jgi:hypothetical protein
MCLTAVWTPYERLDQPGQRLLLAMNEIGGDAKKDDRRRVLRSSSIPDPIWQAPWHARKSNSTSSSSIPLIITPLNYHHGQTIGVLPSWSVAIIMSPRCSQTSSQSKSRHEREQALQWFVKRRDGSEAKAGKLASCEQYLAFSVSRQTWSGCKNNSKSELCRANFAERSIEKSSHTSSLPGITI